MMLLRRLSLRDLASRCGLLPGALALLTGSTISGNVARRGSTLVHGWGGAIYAVDESQPPPDRVITNSTISGNSAMVGGGIFLGVSTASEFVLSNVTITENHASQTAGGVFARRDLTLRNTVIAQNHSFFGPDCGLQNSSVTSTSGGHNFLGNAEVPEWADAPDAEPCLDGSGTGDQVGSVVTPLSMTLSASSTTAARSHSTSSPTTPMRKATRG